MHDVNKFTFHYVSIKSAGTVFDLNNQTTFTFHYVSIKSNLQFGTYIPFLKYLHSTMYLLNLVSIVHSLLVWQRNLHSTMYLLNRGGYLNDKVYLKFTFHYVSIKSGARA